MPVARRNVLRIYWEYQHFGGWKEMREEDVRAGSSERLAYNADVRRWQCESRDDIGSSTGVLTDTA